MVSAARLRVPRPLLLLSHIDRELQGVASRIPFFGGGVMPHFNPSALEDQSENPRTYWRVCAFDGTPMRSSAYRRNGKPCYRYTIEEADDPGNDRSPPSDRAAGLSYCLASLCLDERILFHACAHQEYTFREIGRLLGIHHVTVRRRYQRIVQTLRLLIQFRDEKSPKDDAA
jgi:hypothetical protein